MISRLLIIIVLLSCQAAAAQTRSSGRVSTEGPYQSKVRLLQEKPAEQADAQQLLQAGGLDNYGRALLLRQLAQRGIAAGDTAAAITRFEQALALDGLSPLATTQMQLNLGQLYALTGRHDDAIPLLQAATRGDDADAEVIMTLAASLLATDNPRAAAQAAARAVATGDAPEQWLRFAVHAFYKAGQPGAAAPLQLRLLDRQPDEVAEWVQLAALYRAAGDNARALATLQTAALTGLITEQDDWLRLIQLHLDYGTPDLAAQWLIPLVQQQPDSQHWHWLAQVLLRAGDDRGALDALRARAQVADDPAAWLEFAELAAVLGIDDMALDALRRASSPGAEGAVRGRALLLLGQLLIAQGKTAAAKRAFTSASEFGGVYRSATEWLDYLAARQPTLDTRQGETATEVAETIADTTDPVTVTTPVDVKTVPRLRVYTTVRTTTANRLTETALEMVDRLARITRRERIEWTGPLHVTVTGDISAPANAIDVGVAAPIRRTTPARAEFGTGTLDQFRCVWRRYKGPWNGLPDAWQQLHRDALAAGYGPSGEARQIVLHRGSDRSDAIIELQIGIL
ncbi:MAG: tetratricopeptide repeat protein [Gammaproteobacteria bacterium]|nr:tetratricopeptide repeat protein [Gammaproteobacteria bacterium]